MRHVSAADFTSQWLGLREPVDHRSRAAALTAQLDGWLQRRAGRGRADSCDRHASGTPDSAARRNSGHDLPAPARASALGAVDLGAGAGSNWRYLSSVLRAPLQWRLLDQDAALLARVDGGSTRVMTEVADLAQPLAPLLEGASLVTASALIDLASTRWIEDLVLACGAAQAAVLITLTIDGRVVLDPPDPLDGQVLGWLARDEQRDKGLGPALGPAAPAVLAAALRAHGYAVTMADSDWQLESADASLGLALLDGWCAAAQRQCPVQGEEIAAWFGRRADAIAAGRLRVRVGHQDILGLPPARD